MFEDSEKQKIFLKEILGIQSKLNEDQSPEMISSQKFAQDFVDGFAEESPFVDKDKLKKVQEEYSLEQIIDELKDYDLIDQIDQIIKQFSEADLSHQGSSIDGSIFQDKWEEIKKKYEAYSDSEDINNI